MLERHKHYHDFLVKKDDCGLCCKTMKTDWNQTLSNDSKDTTNGKAIEVKTNSRC